MTMNLESFNNQFMWNNAFWTGKMFFYMLDNICPHLTIKRIYAKFIFSFNERERDKVLDFCQEDHKIFLHFFIWSQRFPQFLSNKIPISTSSGFFMQQYADSDMKREKKMERKLSLIFSLVV